MKKLSKNQQDVVDLLKAGWELGSSHTRLGGNCWLQKNGICRGGQSKNISKATLRALKKKGIIKDSPKREKDPYWLNRYELVGD